MGKEHPQDSKRHKQIVKQILPSDLQPQLPPVVQRHRVRSLRATCLQLSHPRKKLVQSPRRAGSPCSILQRFPVSVSQISARVSPAQVTSRVHGCGKSHFLCFTVTSTHCLMYRLPSWRDLQLWMYWSSSKTSWEIKKNTKTSRKGTTEQYTREIWRIFSALILLVGYSGRNIRPVSVDCHGELETWFTHFLLITSYRNPEIFSNTWTSVF